MNYIISTYTYTKTVEISIQIFTFLNDVIIGDGHSRVAGGALTV